MVDCDFPPKVVYHNGISSPQIQLGTFRIKTKEDVQNSVTSALDAGYRAIDTASVYKNHAKIASTLREHLPKLGLSRKDIFITSKLAPKDHGTEKCEAAIRNILSDLETDYLDLFLIHWPGVQKLDVADPMNRTLRTESWKVLEKYYKQGTFRAIGISNYTMSHMKQLLSECEILPHVVQLELHPHYQQQDLREFCKEHNIHVQAYSSLGAAGSQSPLYTSPVVQQISTNLNKSPAQILLRWGLQRGFTIMPKSVNSARIKENIDLNFTLSDEEMLKLSSINDGLIPVKYTWNPESIL